LILTDLYMPGCSGLELATMVRQHEVFYDIPIVFLTSEAEANTRLAALQLGSDDFFTKSTDTAIVARAIKSRLQRMASYKLVKRAMIWSPN
jgi:PleD family two-component response regulator